VGAPVGLAALLAAASRPVAVEGVEVALANHADQVLLAELFCSSLESLSVWIH
jgi:hypothetical protein